MTITYEWRGDFENTAVDALRAEASGEYTPSFWTPWSAPDLSPREVRFVT
ncbi:hypothetical protein ACI2L1_09660 [Streptomyces sp. NPDC019531]